MISSLTQGQPPLLADLWAINSQLKLNVEAGISGSGSHKKFRDQCLDSFASLFEMKREKSDSQLQKAQWIRSTTNRGFACGAREDDEINLSYIKSNREIELERKWEKLRHSGSRKELQKYVVQLMYDAGEDARTKGLLALRY